MRFCTISGSTLHYEHRDGGNGGPLLVLVNSLGTDFRIWDDVVSHLEIDFSLLRYDKRGHGISDTGTAPHSIEDHVDDLVCLIDHVDAKTVIVCGLSVGGLIAQGLQARRPELVRALILCDTAHKIGTTEFWNARIEAIRVGGIGSIAQGVLERWFTPEFHRERPADLAGCRNMLLRQPMDGYIGTCVALRDADHTELVKRIAVPTLCLVGDQDGATSPALVRSMADLIPGAEFATIANAGHIPCVEQPQELVARIRTFLRQRSLCIEH